MFACCLGKDLHRVSDLERILTPPLALGVVVLLGLAGLGSMRRDIEARNKRTASLS